MTIARCSSYRAAESELHSFEMCKGIGLGIRNHILRFVL